MLFMLIKQRLVVVKHLIDTITRGLEFYRSLFTVMEYSMDHLKNHFFKKAVVSISVLMSCYSFANNEDGLRHSRYCEVVIGKGLRASVYTTFKLNDCPQNLWGKLDAKLIKKQNKATFVYFNGPRHFLFDSFTYHKLEATMEHKNFGGMQMQKAATVKISLRDIIKGFRPYIEHQVYRNTVWKFKSGKPIYELISPKNKVYIMQSYSDELVKQNEASLKNLGSNLQLPRGWKFKTGILQKDENLVTKNNIAVVTQDSFKNTYQLSDKDFLG